MIWSDVAELYFSTTSCKVLNYLTLLRCCFNFNYLRFTCLDLWYYYRRRITVLIRCGYLFNCYTILLVIFNQKPPTENCGGVIDYRMVALIVYVCVYYPFTIFSLLNKCPMRSAPKRTAIIFETKVMSALSIEKSSFKTSWNSLTEFHTGMM